MKMGIGLGAAAECGFFEGVGVGNGELLGGFDDVAGGESAKTPNCILEVRECVATTCLVLIPALARGDHDVIVVLADKKIGFVVCVQSERFHAFSFHP